jgi:hypothetical protein
MTNLLQIALVLPGFSAHPTDWAIPALQNLAIELAQHCNLHIFSQRYPAKGIYRFNGFTHHALGGALADRFDRALRAINIEYASKRDTGRLGAVVLNAVPAGWLARRDRDILAQRSAHEQFKHCYLLSAVDADGAFPGVVGAPA